jgi:hypothetical protein
VYHKRNPASDRDEFCSPLIINKPEFPSGSQISANNDERILSKIVTARMLFVVVLSCIVYCHVMTLLGFTCGLFQTDTPMLYPIDIDITYISMLCTPASCQTSCCDLPLRHVVCFR